MSPSKTVESQFRALPQSLPMTWWLQKGTYFAFVLREMSSVFVAWIVVYVLLLVGAVSQDEASYQAFLTWSATPGILLLNIVSFLFLVFHAVTFFDAAPQAMVVKLGPNKVPGSLILAGHYAGWAAISVVVAYFLLRA
jgi:fumarate reductase subunit C